eukprot:TRINITY_DN25946_c0_g1_i1.p1 TRINITY_DN25946_c0_g1~~TRINITY_DN25946_c0_g1_i1.p1  ORF type:complete len:484 (+),score=111.66 TRINITY_DN25946_c0_g1_i1:176-1627(+)
MASDIANPMLKTRVVSAGYHGHASEETVEQMTKITLSMLGHDLSDNVDVKRSVCEVSPLQGSPHRQQSHTPLMKSPFISTILPEPCHTNPTPSPSVARAWNAGAHSGLRRSTPVRDKAHSPKVMNDADWDSTIKRFATKEKIRQNDLKKQGKEIDDESPYKPKINATSRKLSAGQLPPSSPQRWNHLLKTKKENREELTKRLRAEQSPRAAPKPVSKERRSEAQEARMEWQRARDEKVRNMRAAKVQAELEDTVAVAGPTINPKSRKMMESKSKGSPEEVGARLYGDFKSRQERRAQLAEEVLAAEEDTAECTFAPQVSLGTERIVSRHAHRTDVSTRLYSDALRRTGASRSPPSQRVTGEVVIPPPTRKAPREWLLVVEPSTAGEDCWFEHVDTGEVHPEFPGPEDPWKVFFESESRTCFYFNEETGDSHWGPPQAETPQPESNGLKVSELLPSHKASQSASQLAQGVRPAVDLPSPDVVYV